jgi:hypothetical protein
MAAVCSEARDVVAACYGARIKDGWQRRLGSV